MAISEVRNPSTTTKKYGETVVDESRITELLASCAVTTCSTLHLAGEAMEPTSIYYSIHYTLTRPLHEKRLTLISSHRKMSYIRSRRHNSKMFVYNILYAYALRPVVQ